MTCIRIEIYNYLQLFISITRFKEKNLQVIQLINNTFNIMYYQLVVKCHYNFRVPKNENIF